MSRGKNDSISKSTIINETFKIYIHINFNDEDNYCTKGYK
jgi:hypothetical protein